MAAPEHPTLDSERLYLQPLSAACVPHMVAYVQHNRAHLAQSGPAAPKNYESEEFWYAKVCELEAAETVGHSFHRILVLRDTPEQVIGKCALSAIQRGPMQAAYLGYALDERFVGNGYMHEALGALIGHAFGPLNLHRIMANYMPSNHRSASVLNRLGFQKEGLAKDYLRINGRWQDHVLTSLMNEAWSPSPAPAS